MFGGCVEDDEVERLIAELREMLRKTGFGWAEEQAQAALPPASPAHIVAQALIDAAETVTVDLAQAEIASLLELEVDEIVFKVDLDADGDSDGSGRVLDESKAMSVDEGNWLRGQERKAALGVMSRYADVFAQLRVWLNGIG
jgi:hypothetical protein